MGWIRPNRAGGGKPNEAQIDSAVAGLPNPATKAQFKAALLARAIYTPLPSNSIAPTITSPNPSGNYVEGELVSFALTSDDPLAVFGVVGADASAVSLNPQNGEWALESTDFATKASYAFSFTATGPSGNVGTQDVAIGITKAAVPAPTLTSLTLTGTPEDGQTISAVWTEGGGPVTSRAVSWVKNSDTPISGSEVWSGNQPLLLTLDAASQGLSDGDSLRAGVKLTGPGSTEDVWHWSNPLTFVAAAPVNPPSWTVQPSISGVATVGRTLAGNDGTLVDGSVTSREWLRNGQAIPGANGATYLLTQEDQGATIAFAATATGPGGTERTISNTVGPVVSAVAASVVVTDGQATEGGGINFAFRINLSRAVMASDLPLSVDYALGAGSPPAAPARRIVQGYASGTYSPTAGATGQTYTFQVVDDLIADGSQNVAFTLSNPVGLTIGTASGQAVLHDNDVAAAPSTPPPTTGETVTLSHAESSPITFTVPDVERGIDANGNNWVVGPVAVLATTPTETIADGTWAGGGSYTNRHMHGTMLNPGFNDSGHPETSVEAFDSLHHFNNNRRWISPGSSLPMPQFNAALQYQYGTVIESGTLVKAHSQGSPVYTGARSGVLWKEALSVLPSPPPREEPFLKDPSVGADTMPEFYLGDVAHNPYPSDAAVSGHGKLTYEQAISHLWLNDLRSLDSTFGGSFPQNQQAAYGGTVAQRLAAAAILLTTNDLTAAQKGVIRNRIIAGGVRVENRWEAGGVQGAGGLNNSIYGGGSHWHYFCLAFAAHHLRNAENVAARDRLFAKLSYTAYPRFAEHLMVLPVPHILTTFDYGGSNVAYEPYMVGIAEWMISPRVFQTWAHKNSSIRYTNYRRMVSVSLMVYMTIAKKLGFWEDLWNNPILIEYAHRYYDEFWETGTGYTSDGYHTQFIHNWLGQHFRDAFPVPTTAPDITKTEARDDWVYMWFDQGINRGSIPDASDFEVRVNGSVAALTNVPIRVGNAADPENQMVKVFGRAVAVRLATPLTGGETVTIQYTQGSKPLRTYAKVNVGSIARRTANNLTGK